MRGGGSRRRLLVLAISLVLLGGLGICEGNALKMHYYKKSCPKAEDIVRNVTWTLVAADNDLAPDLLRIHYHDCFVRGCDASVLLDSSKGKEKPEKKAKPNLTLKGFDVIDKVKAKLEEECPGIVSCADVVALVARDAVSFKFQKRMWAVLTGRRDGRISRASEALANLPSPFMDFPALKQLFGGKGLDADDLVVLSGAHTIGEAHCAAFEKRLSNFTGKGGKSDVDLSLDPTYGRTLRKICPSKNPDTTVDMDLGSGDTFDSSYYVNLLKHKALFHSDAALLTNNRAAKLARKLTDKKHFFNMFAKSVRKMGDIEVLTGTQGEIRKKCTRGGDNLEMNFYKNTCPQAEGIVKRMTEFYTFRNPVMGAKLLRLHYHDCFVRGCDASILLDRTGDDPVEKEARPNLSVTGYSVIEAIKTQIERECPDVVSCADIVALAARDAVSFPFQKPLWKVFTGRRDGNVSLAPEASTNLPSPFGDFTELMDLFTQKGLDLNDLVALSGAHTIGRAHCGAVVQRLYNFTGKGDADPSLDPEYADELRKNCPVAFNPNTTLEMDDRDSRAFNSHYFVALREHKGLFQSDAALLTNDDAAAVAKRLQNRRRFFDQFGRSVVRMGAMDVLTGEEGEIRKRCAVVNSPQQ
ncbi:hypothetical protein H6P81_002041 [Aristolochia fimbriata]|uniref:peroxidase n=1 Tax=Aristolochia fimbriata TaxID=158543 RepID=A0AAV7FD66_ARIFI|nr:hypothetical protein H6P81_002041 [Aristolochia fimbriata]